MKKLIESGALSMCEVFNFVQTPTDQRATILLKDRVYLRIEAPCAASSQTSAMENGGFVAARNASAIPNQETIGLVRVAATSDLKRLLHLTRVKGGGSEVRAVMTDAIDHAFAPANYKTSRETAEKAVAQAKNTYEKAKVAAEQATDLLRDTYATAAKGATDYNLKIIEFARANTDTTFDYAQELMEVKHPAELVVVSIAHARNRFATMIAQTKELAELAQRVTTETTAPLRAGRNQGA
jgi:phasin